MNQPHEFSRSIENLIASLRGLPENDSKSRIRHTKPLGESIDKILRQYHIGDDDPIHSVRQQWGEIVGPANAAYSHPVKIDTKGRLVVQIGHAVVRDELRLLEPIVLQRVRKCTGGEKVKALALVTG
jgi:hypothetical protein